MGGSETMHMPPKQRYARDKEPIHQSSTHCGLGALGLVVSTGATSLIPVAIPVRNTQGHGGPVVRSSWGRLTDRWLRWMRGGIGGGDVAGHSHVLNDTLGHPVPKVRLDFLTANGVQEVQQHPGDPPQGAPVQHGARPCLGLQSGRVHTV